MNFRNRGQQNLNNKRIQSDFEKRTFTGNQRDRSPMEAYGQNYRRSPMRIYEQGTSESGMGEMIYLEPNETYNRRGQNMSPLNDSRNMIMRSPVQQGIRKEYGNGGIINISRKLNYIQNQIHQKINNDMEGREILSRSPKTINIGESPQEMEYNVRTINSGRMNNLNMNSPKPNFMNDRSYNLMSNETGNIFLDQPMQQGGIYNIQNDASSSGMMQQGMNEQRAMDQNSREIQFAMNPRDLQEPRPGVLRKMSPRGNVEGDSESVSEKNDNINQIKDLKSQLEQNNNQLFKNEDGIGMGEMNRQNRGDLENIEIMAKTGRFPDNVNVTGEEVKKLIKYYVKTYDPNKGEDGNLISNSQMIIPLNQDKLFNDRYKVLQKMNKLSHILLAKNRNASPDSNLNRSFGEDGKNKFDKKTLNNSTIRQGTKKTLREKGKNKFLYVSLAMLSAKGPNTEDRTILRRMRIDKGGVVDLAQENIQKKSKFKI